MRPPLFSTILFDYVAADARPFDVGVQALGHTKEFVLDPGDVKAEAVVLHAQHMVSVLPEVGEPHRGCQIEMTVFEGVAEQIVTHAPQVLLGKRRGDGG